MFDLLKKAKEVKSSEDLLGVGKTILSAADNIMGDKVKPSEAITQENMDKAVDMVLSGVEVAATVAEVASSVAEMAEIAEVASVAVDVAGSI